jgi:hypothetical protein
MPITSDKQQPFFDGGRKNYKDLGLSYLDALHGVQSAIAWGRGKLTRSQREEENKHLRVGIDSAHCTNAALTLLLVEKGVFTYEEMNEALRLLVNNEVARYEKEATEAFGKEIAFR